MANQCNICGAEINVFGTQKLADGSCICQKNCRSKGLREFDYVHDALPQVTVHIKQVENGTKLWEHYGEANIEEKAANDAETLDNAIYGDRSELIHRADSALAAFYGSEAII